MSKALSSKDWNKLLRKFKKLNSNNWNYLDGLQKLSLLRACNINLDTLFKFGINYNLKYPNDIYQYDVSEKYTFDVTTLNNLRHLALDYNTELGGTINFIYNRSGMKIESNNHSLNNHTKIKVQLLYQSDQINRIDLNVEQDTQILFHTHPVEYDTIFDPPSILDIISYLGLTIVHISNMILDISKSIEHPLDDPLIVQASMVFTKNEIYVYYISYPLLRDIVKKLINTYHEDKNMFVHNVEKLLEEIEISYANLLFRYNRNLSDFEIKEYISFLSSLGIIVKRYDYLENKPEVILVI
jgi:hypothetical protein